MRGRLLTIAAAAAASALLGAGPAPAAKLPVKPCGNHQTARGIWTVLVAPDFSCKTAFDLIASIEKKKVPAASFYPPGPAERKAGVRCAGLPRPGALPESIACGKGNDGVLTAYHGLTK